MRRFISLFMALIFSVSLITVAYAEDSSAISGAPIYTEAFNWAIENNLLKDFEDAAFNTRTICTRSQAVAILWNAAGAPTPTLESHSFVDISPAMSDYLAILWAVEKGITVGCTDYTFEPDEPCTNAQFLTFLWRAEGMPAAMAGSSLAAANGGTYYADALAWADAGGVMYRSLDTFYTTAPVTFADVATYLYMNSIPLAAEETPLAGAASGQLVISQQPESTAVNGGMVSFTVKASGGKTPYSYAWESRSGSGSWYRVYDTTSNTLTMFPAASMISSGLYFRCVVSDAAGNKVTSNEAKVLADGETYTGGSQGTVPTPSAGGSQGTTPAPSGGGSTQTSKPLTITAHPKDAILAGDYADVVFKVEVTGGTPPYTYRWEDSSRYLDWAHVFDSKSSNTLPYTLTTLSAENDFRFRCVITDAKGNSVTSNEASIIYTGDSPFLGELKITEMPGDVSCAAGETVKLSISCVGGELPYRYKWEYRTRYSGWIKLDESSSGTSTRLKATKELLSNGLQIRCTVTDSNGDYVVSDTARVLEVGTDKDGTLKVTRQPQSVYGSGYAVGDSVQYSVEVSGGVAPYSYQWQVYSRPRHEEDVDYTGFYDIEETPGGWATGYTTSHLTVPFAKDLTGDDYQFCCRITDATGKTVVTKPAGFTDAYTGPIVTYQPASVLFYTNLYDVVDGTTTADFYVKTIGGAAPLTYQWQYCPAGGDEYIDFGSADSSWAWGYNTSELTVLARPNFGTYGSDRYQSPGYRCKITAADGQVVYSKTTYTVIYY